MRSLKRAQEVYQLVKDFGVDEASRRAGVSRETTRRYARYAKEETEDTKPDEKLIRQIKDRFTDDELRRLLSTSEINKSNTKTRHSFDGDTIKIGLITDTHLGSTYTDVDMINAALDKFADVGVDMVCHTGDVHEGLSTRPGHYYECSHIGYSSQLNHSREVFSQWTNTPIYFIDGNHDRWYIKSNGALIVEELCRNQGNLHFLGHDEGDIDVNGVTVRLWHGEDGSSYALSYRLQKIIESFTGGEKPNVLLCGHTHKALYVFDRNIHCVSGGALQKQSRWMRSKRAASHTGFWTIDMTIDSGEVVTFNPVFYPFYR